MLSKITHGYVIQNYDKKKKKFISQEFRAGGECFWENAYCDKIDEPEDTPYLSYDMVQP